MRRVKKFGSAIILAILIASVGVARVEAGEKKKGGDGQALAYATSLYVSMGCEPALP